MQYNPFVPDVQENPYPYYAYLREHAPVYQVPGLGFWAVSRYDDVLSILKNPAVFSSAGLLSAMLGDLNPWVPEAPPLQSSDPPSHTRLRRLANRAFTPRRMASIEAHLREVAQHLLEPMAAQGAWDLVHDLAIPFPVIAIAELLGVPPERRHDFKQWTDSFVIATKGAAVTPDEHQQTRQSFAEFRTYFQEAIESCRRQPADTLLSDLVRAEEDHQMLTAEEVLSLAVLVLVGGSETTTNLISNATLALLDHPEQLAKVRANPTLVPYLIEETLRYDAPVQWSARQTTQEVEIAGATLAAGAVVLALFASTNRDERKFPDPDRFDILRNTDGQLGFGFGIHFCLGAQLARLEAKIVLEALLERCPRLTRTDAPVTHIESSFLRGLKTLPLVVS
ncbi:MAG: cytochrome P450 [Candidatus Binatia bacterium]